MTTVENLLRRLNELDVRLRVEGENLRVNAPKNTLTENLRDEIAGRKHDIIAFLNTTSESITPAARSGNIPLSFGQERLWFLDQMESERGVYNQFHAYTVKGALDIPLLEKCLSQIARRHEILRTSFILVDGAPAQIISDSVNITVSIVDFRYHPGDEKEAAARGMATEEVMRPFDLAAAPLMRCACYRLADDESVMVFTMSHIVCDGWSTIVFVRELSALYTAAHNGHALTLPAPPIQYADYALWQRGKFAADGMKSQLDYWTSKLKDAPPSLELPADKTRPPIQTYSGAVERFRIDKDLRDMMRVASQKNGVTMFMTLLAGFAVLLSKYTGQDDVVVGSPVANRNRKELEPLIGFFVNTLPYRLDLAGDPKFAELLQRVKYVVLEGLANQDTPFEKIVEAAQPVRNLSHSPIFQTMFIHLMDSDSEKVDLPGAALTPYDIDASTAKLDITVSMRETGAEILGEMEYNTDLFDAATMKRMAAHFINLLKAAAAAPDAKLSALPMLSDDENRLILRGWNDTAADYPRGKCVHHLVEARAEISPDAIAVTMNDESITYRELNRRANQLAHAMIAKGATRGDFVAIYLERSIAMVVGLLATMKTGAAYVPVDPEFPTERVAFMLSDSGARLVITQGNLIAKLPADGASIIAVDVDADIIATQPDVRPAVDSSPRDLAYVIYTSGSTGRPKGVRIASGSVVNFLNSMSKKPGMTEEDTLLAVTTISFDIAGLELFLPLMTGAKVALASRMDAMDGMRLQTLLAETGATVMQATPATWRLMLAAGWNDARGLKILCGGEALPGDLARRLVGMGAELWNMYGPTETTIWSMVEKVTLDDGCFDQKDVALIGRPIDNTSIYILDKFLRPVPVGVSGELHIGGDGLSTGYLNRPELTAEKFIPDPFSGQPGAMMYKTGDLARYTTDGRIQYIGRVDFQVKLRGFRIEPGEIESVIKTHGNIRDVVVAVREDQPGGAILAAYVTTADDAPIAADELRGVLREKLPEYMIPSVFAFLQAMPLTPNGKIDKKALPAPNGGAVESGNKYLPPASRVENIIADAWRETLRREKVGVHDNIFDLGGHSLLIAQIHNKLRVTFPALQIIDLFKNPTISALAGYLDGNGGNKKDMAEEAKTRAGKRSAASDRQKAVMKKLRGANERG